MFFGNNIYKYFPGVSRYHSRKSCIGLKSPRRAVIKNFKLRHDWVGIKSPQVQSDNVQSCKSSPNLAALDSAIHIYKLDVIKPSDSSENLKDFFKNLKSLPNSDTVTAEDDVPELLLSAAKDEKLALKLQYSGNYEPVELSSLSAPVIKFNIPKRPCESTILAVDDTAYQSVSNSFVAKVSSTEHTEKINPQSDITTLGSVSSIQNLPVKISSTTHSVFLSVEANSTIPNLNNDVIDPRPRSSSKMVLGSASTLGSANLENKKVRFPFFSNSSNHSPLPNSPDSDYISESAKTLVSKSSLDHNLSQFSLKSQLNSFDSKAFGLVWGTEEDDSTFDIANDIKSKHREQVTNALDLMKTQKLNFEKTIDHWKNIVSEEKKRILKYSTLLGQGKPTLNILNTLECTKTMSDNDERQMKIRDLKDSLFVQSKLRFSKLKEDQDKLECLLSVCQTLTHETESLHENIYEKTAKLKSNSHKLNLLKTSEQDMGFINSKKIEQTDQFEKTIKKMREALKQKNNLCSNKIQTIGCYLGNRLADMESSLKANEAGEICLPAFDIDSNLVTKKTDERKFSKIWTEVLNGFFSLAKMQHLADDGDVGNEFSKLVAHFYYTHYDQCKSALEKANNDDSNIVWEQEIPNLIFGDPCDYANRISNICSAGIKLVDSHINFTTAFENAFLALTQTYAEEKTTFGQEKNDCIMQLTKELQELEVEEAREAQENSELIYKSSSKYRKDKRN